MTERWANAIRLHALRQAQLDALSDEQFTREVRLHQRAKWRRQDLVNHTRDHRQDWEKVAGRALAPTEIAEVSEVCLRTWDRMFTGLTEDKPVTFCFASLWDAAGSIILAATRDGAIRTAIPMRPGELQRWIGRHPEIVEVTERARRLGL
jgi:hypothetical protein